MTVRRESRLRRAVIERAGWRCEYCRAPQGPTGQTFHLDHIVPEARGGQWTEENLALACPHCNLARGGQQSAHDPRTGRMVPCSIRDETFGRDTFVGVQIGHD